MAKYEIMLIVSGSLDEKNADKVADVILSSLKKTKVETIKYGNKQLAYQIKKNTHGYYYQYNFETDEVPLINEFRRLCLINKNVLRHLIINLEKDYGYKSSHNEKKIKAAETRAKIYAERKSQFEKAKEAKLNELSLEDSNESTTIKAELNETKKTAKKETKVDSETKKEKKTTTTKKTTVKPKTAKKE